MLITALNLFIKPDDLVIANINQFLPELKPFSLKILSFTRSKENSIFGIYDINGIKLLTCLRLNFAHFNYLKVSLGFRDIIDPMYKCGKKAEATLHYLLGCNLYTFYRTGLLNDIRDKVFKNGPSKICGKQPLKNLKGLQFF